MRTWSSGGVIEHARGRDDVIAEVGAQVTDGSEVDLAAEQHLQLEFELGDAEQTGCPARFELDEQVDVAVVAELVAGRGSEQPQAAYPVLAAERAQHGVVDGQVCSELHGGSVAGSTRGCTALPTLARSAGECLVELEFGPDDEDRFFVVRDELLDRFERWLDAQGRPVELRADAELVLGLKWGYLGGHLGRWRTADLDELLLELYPRKVVADRELAELTVPAVAGLLEFLDEDGLLVPGSDPLPRLLARLDALRGPFLEALGDESRYGLGKSLFGAMMADGVDLADDAAVGGWVEAFNAGPREERDRVLGPAMVQMSAALAGRRRLRPVTLAPVAELERAARDAPAMVRFVRFVAYVTTPRKLTERGNLKLADARELLELLELDDRLDETIGERTFKTKSSTELPTLDLTFRWARAARLVKVRKGELSATQAGRRLDRDVLQIVYQALHGLLELGVLAHRYREDPYGFGWYADEVDAEVPVWLLELYEHGRREVEDLATETWELLLERFDLDDVPADKLAFHGRLVESGVRRILDQLQELGIVTVTAVDRIETSVGTEDRGGGVALTDLGVWAVQRMASVYLDAPVVGALVDVSADELLRQATDMAEDAARAELDAWIAQRDVADAAAELIDALPGADDVAIELAFGALLRIGAAAAPAVRTLQEDPRLGPYATVWLVDTLQIEAEDVRVDEVEGQVALLHAVLELRGPHAITIWLPLMLGVRSDTGRDAIATTVGELWRDRSERAGEVLDAIAAVHPDKPVAKAARKARFKLRSAGS
jgi:hypothetical protein